MPAVSGEVDGPDGGAEGDIDAQGNSGMAFAADRDAGEQPAHI
jgi:hypothetical protein